MDDRNEVIGGVAVGECGAGFDEFSFEEEGPFDLMPLHRLLACGRDRPETPGLAEALGECLARDLLESGLTAEARAADYRTIGERVLGDRRLLGHDSWLDFDRTRDPEPALGCLGDLWDALGKRLTEGLPIGGAGPLEVGRRVVAAYENLEVKQRPLWKVSEHTPSYLQPREAMRCGQTLSDPALRELVERAWDSRVMLHLTTQANRHPASRENDQGRFEDFAADDDRLDAIQVKVGEAVLRKAGVPEGVRLDRHEWFFRKVGAALVEAVYDKGCMLICDADRLWAAGEWDDMVRWGYLSPEEGEKMKLWSSKDYDSLHARGHIDKDTRDWYRQMDARHPNGW